MITASRRIGAFLAAVFAATAISSAYLPLWLADHGLAAAEIGSVLSIAALLRVVGMPAFGWATDRVGRQRAALGAAALTAAACLGALPAAHTLPSVAVLVVLGGFAASALPAIADALTLALAVAGRLDYGRTRVWGSIAYMLATAAAGLLLSRFGAAPVPALLAIGFGVAAVLCLALPAAPPAGAPGPAPAMGAGHFGAAFWRCLVATMLIQGSHAAYYAFASLHWRRAGISDATIGLLISEGIVAEILLFMYGRRLVERLGPSRLTALAAAACIVRWSVLAVTVSVPILAVVQLLHACTFACQHLSSQLVLRETKGPRAALAQSVLSALGFSGPTGVLTWVSGQLYGSWGGLVFLVMAVVGGSALVIAPSLPGPRCPEHSSRLARR